jgi:hypothetical protein
LLVASSVHRFCGAGGCGVRGRCILLGCRNAHTALAAQLDIKKEAYLEKRNIYRKCLLDMSIEYQKKKPLPQTVRLPDVDKEDEEDDKEDADEWDEPLLAEEPIATPSTGGSNNKRKGPMAAGAQRKERGRPIIPTAEAFVACSTIALERLRDLTDERAHAALDGGGDVVGHLPCPIVAPMPLEDAHALAPPALQRRFDVSCCHGREVTQSAMLHLEARARTHARRTTTAALRRCIQRRSRTRAIRIRRVGPVQLHLHRRNPLQRFARVACTSHTALVPLLVASTPNELEHIAFVALIHRTARHTPHRAREIALVLEAPRRQRVEPRAAEALHTDWPG